MLVILNKTQLKMLGEDQLNEVLYETQDHTDEVLDLSNHFIGKPEADALLDEAGDLLAYAFLIMTVLVELAN